MDARSAFRGEGHHAEDAFAVYDGVVLADLNVRLEAVRDLDELRPRPDVHAERVDDARLTLDHGHIHPTMRATAPKTSARRSPSRRPPRDSRNIRNATTATAASARRVQEPNAPARYWAVIGRANPTANAIADPSTVVAFCRTGWCSATLTRVPWVQPAFRAHHRRATWPML